MSVRGSTNHELSELMRYTTPAHVLPLLIAPVSFGTHDVEREFRRVHPGVLAAEFARFAAADDPLHRFSAKFGRWLLDSFPAIIRPTRKVRSTNLRGRISSNQEWEWVRR